MDNEKYKKVASEISNKLISLWKNKQTDNKNIIELYNELLDEKYKSYKSLILSYIPEYLAAKGYVIVNSEHFDLRKY